MIVIGAPESIYARGFFRPRARVELLNACSGLNSRSPREDRFPMVNREPSHETRACYSETHAHRGLVEQGPSSTFVAQILGQDLLTTTPDPDACGRAYARAALEQPTPRLLRLA
jgi:hypothetical protein